MNSLVCFVGSAAFAVLLVSGCTVKFGGEDEKISSIPAGTVKPDIDYSAESPGCEVAAQRLTENVQVGMTLGDVRRLVGKPRMIIPGAWYWTAAVGKTGRPLVKYAFGPAEDDVPIKAFSTDTTGC